MLKVLILAGGLGSRLGYLSENVPKPLVSLCGKPISFYLVDIFKKQGFSDFIFAVGYKKEKFHETLKKTFYHGSDVEYSFKYPKGKVNTQIYKDCSFRVIDTGLYNQTGSRVSQVFSFIDDDILICTYGDGLANVSIKELLSSHKKSKTLATITAVNAPARFGGIKISDNKVISFSEKKNIENNWINGGFMVITREFVDRYLNEDQDCILEDKPLENAAKDGNLGVFKHQGFWQCMDTPRDHKILEDIIRFNNQSNKLF